MRGLSAKRILLLATAAASLGWGQVPTITSVQAFPAGPNNPPVTGITSGTPLPNGFSLFINGTFSPLDVAPTVTWLGTSVSVVSFGSTQIEVTIPNTLFTTPVAHVTVTVTEITGASSSDTTFAINPPLTALGLPSGTINLPYSANLTTGGTAPFAVLVPNGGLPTGITPQPPSVTLTGTPTATGLFTFQPSIKDAWNNNVTPADAIEIVAVPTLTSLSPNSSGVGAGNLTMTVIGTNFVGPVTFRQQQIPGSQVQWRVANALTTLATTFNPNQPNQLTAIVPSTLLATAGAAGVAVVQPSNASSNVLSFSVVPLAIATTSLPPGNAGSTYSASLTGRGGTPPYTWAASGFPPALSVNPATGVLSGVLLAGGTYLVTVVLHDAARSTASAQFPLVVGPPPVSIAPSGGLPSGVVGVAYLGSIGASGGSGTYTFSLGSGSLPDGLTLSSAGSVSGTPKTPGQFAFSVVVTDSTGATGSQDFGITIQPAPLNITGGPTTPVSTGTPINITFGGTGGVGPYRFSPGGSLPPGTTFINGVLSGTPTTAGAFTFRVTLADSTGAVVSKDFTLTVEAPPPPKLSLSGSLRDGQVGVPYAGQISASGGLGPYSYSGSGLPDGLSLSASGSVSGTPGTAGQFSFTATATDSKGATANGTFPITIAPADLTIVTASLPDGVVGVAYAASLIASGGVKPYTWTVTGLPDGVTATAAGAISGTPKTAGKFTVNVIVTDGAGTSNASRRVSYSVTIAPAAPLITTASAPNGTAGTAYSASFAASGGTAPYIFSATGLPAGLSMSAAGAISGTPTAPGAATIVVTVKDAAGASTPKSFPVTIGLPTTPPLNLNLAGISDTASPLQQPRLQVVLANSYPVDVVVSLTLAFAPDSGADDPAILFSGGGRTARITVPAGATNGATDIGVQTGSVAGLIAITGQMQAAGQDVTPSPAPRRTIRIAAAAPVIVPGTLTAVRNSTGFTVTLTGYVTDREMTQAVFQFTAAAGSNLQTTTLTVPIDALFAPYFSGAGATATGSQFTYTQPFTVTGSTQAIASVTVTLVNKIGQSTSATATLN